LTANPYAPPAADVAGAVAPPAKSFARRVSFLLAGAGFVVFWAAAVLAAASTIGEMLAGACILTAMIVHVIGVAVPFAAPRGRRLAPVLVNAISLAIQLGILVVGLTTKGEF
jgi:hypothetical protein